MTKELYIDRILYPVDSLGPGRRLAIWVTGCNRHCPGCANPELWERREYQRIETKQLAEAVRKNVTGPIDGITITGGEPFEQADALADLLEIMDPAEDVLIFTGYRIEELSGKKDAEKLLSRVAVLIDGEYMENLNDGVSALRGSVNQRILFLRENVRETYGKYLSEGRKIRNFLYDYKTISTGIHSRGK